MTGRFSGGTIDRVRVLHIVSGDRWAGAERMVTTLLKQLAKRSDVEVLALSLNEGILTSALRAEGIETQVMPESECMFHDLVRQAAAHYQDRGIDVIHAHRNKENLLACCISKRCRVKRLVTTLHGLSEARGGSTLGRLRRYLLERLDDRLLRHMFDSIVAVSEDIRRTVLSRGYAQAQVTVIHNGIDLPTWTAAPRGPSKPIRIGSVGRFVPVKDFRLFIMVGKALLEAGEDVHLALLGEGPLKEELEAVVIRERLDKVISFVDPCLDPSEFYRSLDLYLNTSSHEGIPLSILEAMSWGTPVVAPAVGGIPEIVRDQEEGLLVPTRKPTAFSDACRRVMHDHECYRDMGRRARKRVETEFASDKMADAYRALYGSLCNVQSPSGSGKVETVV